ncbi:MAG: M15 family metallopeptidase [Treponema sp.]|nr:M15 family metallopeptidase [Treponema sp.]
MNRILKLLFFLLIFINGNIFALGNQENAANIDPVIPELNNETGNTIAFLPAPESSRAEQVMKALAAAYPQQIEYAEFRDGDWAVLLRDKWYYYADGRILPQELRSNAADYSGQPFYNYQIELPPWREPSADESSRYRNMTNNRRTNPPRRSSHFFDDLWRAHNRDESYERVKTIRFLGKSTMVHYMILEELSLVEEHILAAAKTDPQVQTWINNLDTLEGWLWRNIAETQSRSYHSYGLAVDLIPRSWGGRETYWLWAAERRSDWWNISYNNRFHPPAAVIKAFETFGFIWGGKWTLFDTMHFEYRPEILILSGIPVQTRR